MIVSLKKLFYYFNPRSAEFKQDTTVKRSNLASKRASMLDRYFSLFTVNFFYDVISEFILRTLVVSSYGQSRKNPLN